MLIATAAFRFLPFLPVGVPLDVHGVAQEPEEAAVEAGAAA